MQLLDYNQIAIASVFASTGFGGTDVDEDFIRHIILNTIRSHHIKNKAKYGEMIICCDGSNSWRRDYFKEYKAGRREGQKENKDMWQAIFKIIGSFKVSN